MKKENLDAIGFKFKIGETVYHKLKCECVGREKGRRTPFFIIERLAQECPGGVQKIYRCRMGVAAEIYANAVTVEMGHLYDLNEVEVEE